MHFLLIRHLNHGRDSSRSINRRNITSNVPQYVIDHLGLCACVGAAASSPETLSPPNRTSPSNPRCRLQLASAIVSTPTLMRQQFAAVVESPFASITYFNRHTARLGA